MKSMGSLGQRVLRSSVVTIAGYGFNQVVRLGSNLILTRLLFPEAFGLMALVNVFMMGVVLLSDLGISQSVMQSKRGDDPVFLDTAWTVQIVRGSILTVVAVVASCFRVPL